MGEVYRARDARLGREVALKVLPAQLSADPGRLRRFEQEARIAGAVNHPNVLAVFDVGSAEGAPYLVSELLEGETLRKLLHDQPLPPRKALDYAAQLARGLAAAHDKGVVHRDLKPACESRRHDPRAGGTRTRRKARRHDPRAGATRTRRIKLLEGSETTESRGCRRFVSLACGP
jgi:aminoglycoside phosphotransferase (APT) family kinase protein